MIKKSILSLAAASAIAIVLTGCGGGSSSNSNDDPTKTKEVTTIEGIDDKILHSSSNPIRVTCDNGSATVSNDGTITVDSANPGTCTLSGGYTDENGSEVANEAILKAVVTPNSEGVVKITPLTTMVEAAIRIGNLTKEEATKKALSVIGLDPTDENMQDVSTIDPRNFADDSAVRKNIINVFLALNVLGESNSDTLLSNLVQSGDTNSTRTMDEDDVVSSMIITGVDPSIADDFNKTMQVIASGNNSSTAIIAAFMSQADAIKDTNTDVNQTAFQDNLANKENSIQSAYENFYVAGVESNDKNGTYRLNFDSNKTGFTPVENNVTEIPYIGNLIDTEVQFKLSNQNMPNATDTNYTADLSFEFINLDDTDNLVANGNYSFQTVLEDITIIGDTNGTYEFVLDQNGNVSYSGIDIDGEEFTKEQGELIHSAQYLENNGTYSEMPLFGEHEGHGPIEVVSTSSGLTTIELGNIAYWTASNIDADMNHTYNNGNWSVKITLSIDGQEKILNAQRSGNLSESGTESINFIVDGGQTPFSTQGTVLFDGMITKP